MKSPHQCLHPIPRGFAPSDAVRSAKFDNFCNLTPMSKPEENRLTAALSQVHCQVLVSRLSNRLNVEF